MTELEHITTTLQSNGLSTVEVDAGGETLKVQNVLFLCKFGSHLHGTTTPTSDIDLKALFMSDLNDIVLGRDQETFTVSTGDDSRNGADDVDIEFIELRKFLDDAMKGQTYAVELLHVNGASKVLTSNLYEEMRSHKGKLLTSNVKPFIGYCVAQAKKYGMKGARLQATEDAMEYMKGENPYHRIENIIDAIPKNEFVFIVEKDLEGQDEPVRLLEVNGKQFDLRVKLQDVIPVLKNLVNKYGARARRAKDGVDWKAVGHAYRCIYELEELLKTGGIEFPLKDREFLLKVKTGKIDYDRVQDELPALIERVENIDSDLPDKADAAFWENWLLTSYQNTLQW